MNPRLTVALQTTLVGAAGGFLGFMLSEVLEGQGESASWLAALQSTAVWTALIMLPLSLTLMAAENVLGLRGRWWRDMGRICLPALLLGAVSGAVAQLCYGLALSLTDVPPRLVRGLGWGLMGAGVGLVLGLADRSWKKAWHGVLGGAVGGTVGGLVFDSFVGLSVGAGDPGTLARMFGITVLGAAIGFMLRLSQDLFKQAWLMGTTTGPFEGKQYVLSKDTVTVGRSDSQDIVLFQDQDVPLQAGQFVRRGKEWLWEGGTAELNGQRVTQATVHSGDRLRFGTNEFVFQEKGGEVAGGALQERLALHADQQVIALPVAFTRVVLGSAGSQPIRGEGVLPKHAELRVQNGALSIHAFGPVAVNEQVLPPGQSTPVRAGDLLRLGTVSLAILRVK